MSKLLDIMLLIFIGGMMEQMQDILNGIANLNKEEWSQRRKNSNQKQ